MTRSTIEVAHFRYNNVFFSNQNRRNVDVASKNDIFIYLGREIIRRDAISFFAEVSFRVRYGAP